VRGVGKRVYGVPLWRGGGDSTSDGGGGIAGSAAIRSSSGSSMAEGRSVRCWSCFVVDGRVPDLFGL